MEHDPSHPPLQSLSPLEFHMDGLKEDFEKAVLKAEGSMHGLVQTLLEGTERKAMQELQDTVLLEVGYWGKSHRVDEVKQAIEWAQAGFNAFYAEIDIRNVSGANSALGSNNKCNSIVFVPIAKIIRDCVESGINIRDEPIEKQRKLLRNMLGPHFKEEEIEQIIEELKSAWVYFFRHGGDELSFVIVGIPERMLTVLLDNAYREIAIYEEAAGLKFIPHPKHLFSPSKHWGVSIAYGYSVIEDGMTTNQIFEVADTRVEKMKKSGKVSYGRGSGSSATAAPRYSWGDYPKLFKLALRSLRGAN